VTWKWLEANEQRDLAKAHLRRADAQRQAAMFQTYRARLAAAVAALSAHDVADARRQLEEAPEHLRDWEWRHLHSRLDDSSAVIPSPSGESGILIPGPNRLRVGVISDDGLHLKDLEGGEPSTVPFPGNGTLVASVTQTRLGLRVAAWVGHTALDLLDEAGRVVLTAAGSPQEAGTKPSACGTRPQGSRSSPP
jgi:hypothetical protein